MDEAAQIIRLVRGSWLALCVRATCELGIVDALDEPLDLTALAQRTGADPATLHRLLRVLVDEGLLAVDGGRYAVTSLGDHLRDGHPSGLRAMALMQSVAPNLAAWGQLADAVRRGAGVYEEVNGSTLWERLERHPDEEATFNAAMARRGEQQVAALLAARDFAGVRLLVDVGGGRGAMATALLQRVPGLHAVVADRPEVARAATEAFAAAGLGDRGHGSAADFFSSVPAGGDVYVLSNVLHDWGDDEAIAILRTVRAATGDDATLLVVESLLDAPEHSPAERAHIHLLDLHMLVMFGARERTKAEYDELLLAAGFTASTSLPSRSSWNVLEARPVS